MIKRILDRIYADFFMPSRIEEYKNMLQMALSYNYEHLTLLEQMECITKNNLPPKIFVHRHDIDTDLRTTKKIFKVEQELGVKTSYYFRLSTIDIPLMQKINASGSEVGYHYEEIAQYCKDHNIHDWEEVKQHMPEIRQIFRTNFLTLQKRLGFKIRTIASHGDFVNRKLQHQNYELLTDELRNELGIEVEGYDKLLVDSYQLTQSDKPYPKFYRESMTPEQAISEGISVIYLLTHPRHWCSNIWVNLKDNLIRLKEGIKYKL